ncbi:hypothetical protein Tco_0472029 [Tanacetum coccineum]
MADVNAPVEQAPAVAPPTRTDEQILPRIRWVPIGKSNCYLDAEKSSTIPAIYIQQFWDTICYDRTAGGYKCQLDEQWFNLTKDTLRDALRITPVNNNKAFSSPPTQDTLINFVNDLGYPKEVKHLSNVVTNDMFQPWRALTTIINLCLTGKIYGFERPRAPVLQILWGIINRAYIDYAERMKEEKTLHVIPKCKVPKLIIFLSQRKHKFVQDRDTLHLHTEGNLFWDISKFSVKTKRSPLGCYSNELITVDIRGADYYRCLSGRSFFKRPKHQRYSCCVEHLKQQPRNLNQPPTKPKEKKRKQAKETTEATPPAKRAKAGKVGIPLTEPGFGGLRVCTQSDIEDVFVIMRMLCAPQCPLPLVVFRETDTGKFQPLPEVEGKGKEKVGAEQAAQVLLNLQTPKKRAPVNPMILSGDVLLPTEPSGHDESSSLYVELGLTESDTESDEKMPPVVKSGDQDEGHAGPDPGIQDKGQAEPNPDDVAESQPLSTPGVHDGRP